MKSRFKEFCKKNILVFVYAVLAISFELVSIAFIGCYPFLTKPLYAALIFGILLSVLFLMRNTKMKAIFSCIFLTLQLVLDIGFVYLYDSNGTFFEWAMMNQRNDAYATIEDLSLRWGLVATLCILLVGFIILTIILFKKVYKQDYKYRATKPTRAVIGVLLSVCALFMVLNPVINGINDSKLSYIDRFLYGDGDNKYQQLGITANAVYEFFNGTVVNSAIDYDLDGLEEFLFEGDDIYLNTSEYFGISKGNNLVYILVESFEWFVFLENITKEQSLQLYPNINKFLENSVYADSFYSREKTDTVEMLATLGSNPTNKYINYDFSTNSYPWSLPNMFRESVEQSGNTVKQIYSFHQNEGSFYNRKELHESIGYDKFFAIEDMEEYGVENNWNQSAVKGERNMDSVTIEKMQDVMFPETEPGEQYMTFWITFCMHGYYMEREGFKEAGYYDKLDEVGAYPAGIDSKGDSLRTYAAAVMDFDKALGMIFDKLEANGQLDNTTIVLFGDHNAYYSNLSYYAKGIEDKYNSELYRVPFMIYDTKLKAAYEENEGTNVISKFTTTSDMLPTIFDMFGIKGYKNLYFGTSMFVDGIESIIFSRSYGIFVTDKLICYSVKNLLYTSEGFTDEDLADFEARAKIHLEKLEYLDKVYYNDYFKTHEYVYPI